MIDLEKLAEGVKQRLPFALPDIHYKYAVEKDFNVLSGHTRMEKKEGEIQITVTIHVSGDLLLRPNIENGIRLTLAHELCHVVNPYHPDVVMEQYLPEMWEVWKKLETLKAIECDAKLTRIG